MEVNTICTPHIVWPQKEISLREEGGIRAYLVWSRSAICRILVWIRMISK